MPPRRQPQPTVARRGRPPCAAAPVGGGHRETSRPDRNSASFSNALSPATARAVATAAAVSDGDATGAATDAWSCASATPPPAHETPHSRVGGNGYSRGHQPRRDGGVGRPSPSGATRPGHAPALARRRQPRAQAPAPPPHTSTFAPVTRQRRAARQPQEDPRLGLSRAITPPAAGHGRRADALPRPQEVHQPLHPVCRGAPTRRKNRAPQGATVGDRGGHLGRHRDGRLHAAHRRTGRRLGAAAARGRAGGGTIARKNVVGKCQVSRREHQVTWPVAGPFRPAPCQGRDQTSVDGGGGGDGCRRPDADRRGVSRPPLRPPSRTAAAAAQQPPAPAMPPTLATTAAVAAATHGCLPA